MSKTCYRITILIAFMILLNRWSASQPAAAQWPPFRFEMTPVYEEGKITYNIEFAKRIEGALSDVLFKIPLPEGTEFVEATAQPTTAVDFDGAEITFLTAVLHEPIRTASFVVEPTDPAQTEFTTQAWIAWQGDLPGDYWTEPVTLDITKQALDWSRPRSRLRLEVGATLEDEVITYTIYPKKLSRRRMWDLTIKTPLPPGTSLLSTEAPPPFVTDFDGQEITFSAAEVEYGREVGPLIIKVSAEQATEPFVVTHAWAVWKNVGRSVGRRVEFQEETRSGDIIIRPPGQQQVVADPIGDAPLPNYDLTGIALQGTEEALKMNFYTAGPIGPVGEPLEYILYIDSDCNPETGASRGGRGVEYWVRYKHTIGKAAVYTWNDLEKSWKNPQLIQVDEPAGQKTMTLGLAYDLFEANDQFCWVGRARNRSEAFTSNLQNEWVGGEPRLTRYDLSPETTADFSPPPTVAEPWGLLPAETPPAVETAAPIEGNLAVPLDNGRGFYEVHIFALPDGREISRLPYARQPHFHPTGDRLVVNREGGGAETIAEYDLTTGLVQPVSDDANDGHPFYDPWGNRVTYDRHEPGAGADRSPPSFIFVQCGLEPPHQEPEPRCRDLTAQGRLIPAGRVSDLEGAFPVWTDDDRIAYKGCNSWAGFSACGLYIVPSASTAGFSDGFTPRRLTTETSDTPSDTQDEWIAFSSNRDGNWEAYVMDLNGDRVRNLSNHPTATDGLPTLAPDGQGAAFVSDRDGVWAVWAVSITGGQARKLFDLPSVSPWGDDDRGWLTERISWGPEPAGSSSRRR